MQRSLADSWEKKYAFDKKENLWNICFEKPPRTLLDPPDIRKLLEFKSKGQNRMTYKSVFKLPRLIPKTKNEFLSF